MLKVNYRKSEVSNLVYEYAVNFVDAYNLDEDTRDTIEALVEFLAHSLIYYYQQWEVIEEYFTPSDDNISLNDAIEYLIDDILSMIEEE